MTQSFRFHIRPIAGDDHAEWSALYADYATFYAVNQSVAMREHGLAVVTPAVSRHICFGGSGCAGEPDWICTLSCFC